MLELSLIGYMCNLKLWVHIRAGCEEIDKVLQERKVFDYVCCSYLFKHHFTLNSALLYFLKPGFIAAISFLYRLKASFFDVDVAKPETWHCVKLKLSFWPTRVRDRATMQQAS